MPKHGDGPPAIARRACEALRAWQTGIKFSSALAGNPLEFCFRFYAAILHFALCVFHFFW